MRRVLHRSVIGPYRIGPPASSALIRLRTRVIPYDLPKWIGAWDFNFAGMPNIVTGSPGTAATLTGSWVFSGSGGVGGSGCVANGSGQAYGGQPSQAQTPLGSFTIACFAACTSGNIWLCWHTSASNGYWSFWDLNFGSGLRVHGVSLGLPPTFNPGGGVLSHYLFQYNHTTGVVRLFVNGTLWHTVTTYGGLTTYSGLFFPTPYLSVQAGSNFKMDNLVFAREYLSDGEIASLAAGNMPDASGALP